MGDSKEKSKSIIQTIIPTGKKFVADTVTELKQSNWPPKNELMESTLLVIVAVVILGFFIAGVDWLIREGLNMLITK